MNETAWNYATNGRTFGPTTCEHLRQLAAAGDLTPDTPVCRGGDSSWVRAADVPGLFLPLPPHPDSRTPRRPVSPGPKPTLLDSFRERVVSADDLLQLTSGWGLVMVLAGFLCGTCGFCFSGCGRDSSSGPSGPTPPDHLPVRVEVYPRSGSRPVLTVINATTDRTLPDVTVSLTSAEGGPAAEVRPGGGRRLGPGERVGLSADDFGGRVPANGDVVRVWAANEKDPPLVFTVRFLANQVK